MSILDPELKKKWLQALRSGEYRQGSGYLCNRIHGEYRHCCLGVLAEVAGVPRETLYSEEFDPDEEAFVPIRHEQLTAIGRDDLLGEWGEGSFYPSKEGGQSSIQRRLAALNDTKKTFAQIADHIEASDDI